MRTSFSKRLIASGLIAAIGANLAMIGPAFAEPRRDRAYGREDSGRDHGRNRHGANRTVNRDHSQKGWPDDRRRPAVRTVKKQAVVRREAVRYKPAVPVVSKPVVVHKAPVVHKKPVVKTVYRPHPVRYGPPTRVIVVPQRRLYRNVWVVRNYGHRYHGYGRYYHDSDAYPWLAFTAISVALIGALSEAQQRSYEDAQIRATTAPVGQAIVWNQAGAYGSITPVREGTSSVGRYCREFQQTVTIGGRTEQAYGTACMQPDGAWEVVSQ